MSRPVLIYYEILRFAPAVRVFMDEHFEVLTVPSPEQDTSELLSEAEAFLAPPGYPVGAEKMNRCPRLRWIASSTLSVPHIDVEAAAARGIDILYLSERERPLLEAVTPTAELCWALIIALTRHLGSAHHAVCEGRWDGRHFGQMVPKMLSSMTLGILGLGRLGSMVAARGQAFGMEVCYLSPHTENSAYRRCESIIELAAQSDVLSVHAHLTPKTRRICDASLFDAMRPGSYLVNTGRGELVDEAALLEALKSGHLAGAATDVLTGEHDRDFKDQLLDNPMVRYAREHDNLLITPHYAGATVDAWTMTQMRTIELVVERACQRT